MFVVTARFGFLVRAREDFLIFAALIHVLSGMLPFSVHCFG